jgi:hypothetical protein
VSFADWVNNGWLVAHESSKQEIANLLGIVARDTALGVSSRPNLIVTSYPQLFSEGELRGLFRSTLKTIYR